MQGLRHGSAKQNFSEHFRSNCKFPGGGKIFSKIVTGVSFQHLGVTTLFFKTSEKEDNDMCENI